MKMRLAFLFVLIFLETSCVALSSTKFSGTKNRKLQGFNFGQPFETTPAPTPAGNGGNENGDGDYYDGGDGDY